MSVDLKGNKLTLVIDVEEFEDYKKKYKYIHPNQKLKLKTHMFPSLNIWLNMNRYKRNSEKQSYHEFVLYLMTKHNLCNLNISSTSMSVTFYWKTKHKKDLDNYIVKSFLDGLVDCNFLEEDNHTILNPLSIAFGGYDKENERVEVCFALNNDCDVKNAKKLLKQRDVRKTKGK